MRFYFQDAGQKVATKCVRVSSTATATDVIKTLIEKFRPDIRMLSIPDYALYEIHENEGKFRSVPSPSGSLVFVLTSALNSFILHSLLKTIFTTAPFPPFPVLLSGERKLADDEKPLLVQLNWHRDDREGRFLLRRMDEETHVS